MTGVQTCALPIFSCVGTNLTTVWLVITRDENGPIGLVADDIGQGRFKGFFSTDSKIVKYAVDLAAYELRMEMDLMKKDWESAPGGY